jgi:hypothetical protein
LRRQPSTTHRVIDVAPFLHRAPGDVKEVLVGRIKTWATVRSLWAVVPLAAVLLSGSPAPEPAATVLRTPLVLDLGGKGVQLTSLQKGTRFDFRGDMMPSRTAWIAGQTAFLALDADGDGKITSGAELFGSDTPTASGGTAKNGFEALARYDENGDGVIDARDPVFSRLRLWRDLDANGMGEPEELQSLEQAGVVALELKHETRHETDAYGNLLGERARFRWKNGKTGQLVDVYLRGQPVPNADPDRGEASLGPSASARL